MSVNRFRDQLRGWVPWWLSDRHYSTGESVGFRYLWSMVATLDCYMEYALEGLMAAWPGTGTPTALPLIGRSRGILRGQEDTDAIYASKLQGWLTKWAGAGTQRQLAVEVHEYLGNAPMVRVVNRAGHMVTVASNGTITTADIAWNWDGTSNPERSGFWSELWVIVYPTQWILAGTWGDGDTYNTSSGLGWGHGCSRQESDAVRGIVAQWKAAHSRVRCVTWTSDAALFDPTNPSSLPDGNWGQWGIASGSSYIPSDRNEASCRHWEMI